MLKKIRQKARCVVNQGKALKKSLSKEKKISLDRRLNFRDLSTMSEEKRAPNSPLLQFYSSANNIGNYLPVSGIQEMLEEKTDTWCAHDKNIDFNFVNSHYKGIIIGGAGLLHKSFNPFWKQVSTECNLPIIIWGVGICVPDDEEESGVSKSVVADVVERCDLVNVRDELTASWYEIGSADISPCPTVAYLDGKSFKSYKGGDKVLFSMHLPLISKKDAHDIERVAETLSVKTAFTNNRQSIYRSVDDLIQEKYVGSQAVVTTRLHGAIIAYGLRIPYVAIPRDDKIRSFHKRYSNGIMIENIRDINSSIKKCTVDKKVSLPEVYSFGKKAKEWYKSIV